MTQPNPFTVTPDNMSLGEFVAFEEFTGFSIAETIEALEEGQAAESATVLIACVFIAGTRLDPAFSLADAGAGLFTDIKVSDGQAEQIRARAGMPDSIEEILAELGEDEGEDEG